MKPGFRLGLVAAARTPLDKCAASTSAWTAGVRAGTRTQALAPAVPKMSVTGGDALALDCWRMTARPMIRLTLRSICLVRSELLADGPHRLR